MSANHEMRKKMKKLKRKLKGLSIMSLAFAIGCSSAAGLGQTVKAATDAPASNTPSTAAELETSYPIVDSGQVYCYEDGGSISCPTAGEAFYGQDAQYSGNQSAYVDNGDGTVTDTMTGLMWQQDPGEKMTFDEAAASAEDFSLAGYDDWRLPTIKELYSLIQFSGYDPSGDTSELVPFIDDVFNFEYGDTDNGERIIDSQFASSNKYVYTTMGGDETMFGVNFADGRIKGYPTRMTPSGQPKTFFVIYVRGNSEYGINEFMDNGNGTITDLATALTWMQNDSESGMAWDDALAYCENQDFAELDDWRLPNVKELQSIVDYSRSPDTTNSAAIDPLFETTSIINEAGQKDYPYYWSSTTHASPQSGMNASYVAFGRAMGYMGDSWMDVHGAGSQRSDPKAGDAADYPTGHGPQGDAIRIQNYVRCVSGGVDDSIITGGETDASVASGKIAMKSGGQDTLQIPSTQGEKHGQDRTPPQEAIDACLNLIVGGACTVITPNGTINGTCENLQTQLVCVPEGGPSNGGGQQPPPANPNP
jgi:hypothetical protein